MAVVSEFGGHVGPHGIHPKPQNLLSAAEKLRLHMRVGLEDPMLPEDPARHAWHGTDPQFYERPDIVEAKTNGV